MSHTETERLQERAAKHLKWNLQEVQTLSLAAIAAIVTDEALRREIQEHIRSGRNLVGHPLEAAPARTGHLQPPADTEEERRRGVLYDLFRAVATTTVGPCPSSPRGTWSIPVEIPVELLLPYGRGKAIPNLRYGETGQDRLNRLRESRGTWKPIEVAFAPGCAPHIVDGHHRLLVAEERKDPTITAQAIFVEKPWWPCAPRAGNPTYAYHADTGPVGVREIADRLRARGIHAETGTEAVYGEVDADDRFDAAARLNEAAGFTLVRGRDIPSSFRADNPHPGVVEVCVACGEDTMPNVEHVCCSGPPAPRAGNPDARPQGTLYWMARMSSPSSTAWADRVLQNYYANGQARIVYRARSTGRWFVAEGETEPDGLHKWRYYVGATLEEATAHTTEVTDRTVIPEIAHLPGAPKATKAELRAVTVTTPPHATKKHACALPNCMQFDISTKEGKHALQLAKALAKAKMLGKSGRVEVKGTVATVRFGTDAKDLIRETFTRLVTNPKMSPRKPNPILPAYGKIDKSAPSAPDRVGKKRAR